MKLSAATLLSAILSIAAHANAECEPGKTEEVVPGYNVEYGCNTYRTGTLHRNIGTIEQCAQICKDAASNHCSYGPSHKQCVVGDESGTDKARSGVYYMKRLADDPFPEDDDEPFPADCESDKEACESEKADLDAKLKDCEGKRSASAFSFDSAVCPRDTRKEVNVSGNTYRLFCGRHHNSAGPKNTVTGVTLPECIDYCSRRSWCDYALFRPTDYTCNTYERKVAYTLEPGVVSQEWKCAVKKR